MTEDEKKYSKIEERIEDINCEMSDLAHEKIELERQMFND